MGNSCKAPKELDQAGELTLGHAVDQVVGELASGGHRASWFSLPSYLFQAQGTSSGEPPVTESPVSDNVREGGAGS